MFCIKYAENGGNGTNAIIQAGYTVNDDRSLASVIASENLRKPNIKQYLKELYKAQGLDESVVEMEHAYLIEQRADLSVKVKAIELYYKLTGKIGNDSITNIQVNSGLQEALDRIRRILPD